MLTTYRTELVLPAYEEVSYAGHLFCMNLFFSPAASNAYVSNCSFSATILEEVSRILSIMYQLKKVYHMLKGKFYIKHEYPKYEVGSTASAGLGIAISLFNLVRQMNGSSLMNDIVGTGFVRLNGGIEAVDGIGIKEKIVLDQKNKYKKLLTVEDIRHLKFLDKKLMQHSYL